MTPAAKSTLRTNPASTSHSKSRLQNKHQLTGNCITTMKTTEGFSIMTKKQVLTGSEPSRIPLNISNTKNERLFHVFSRQRPFPLCPAPLRQLFQLFSSWLMRFGAGWWHPGSGEGTQQWGHSCPDICSSSESEAAVGVTQGTPRCSRSALHTKEQLLGAAFLQILQQGPAVGAERGEQRMQSTY